MIFKIKSTFLGKNGRKLKISEEKSPCQSELFLHSLTFPLNNTKSNAAPHCFLFTLFSAHYPRAQLPLMYDFRPISVLSMPYAVAGRRDISLSNSFCSFPCIGKDFVVPRGSGDILLSLYKSFLRRFSR